MGNSEKKPTSFLVLTQGDFQIYREPYCYMVVRTKVSESSGERYRASKSETYHVTLEDAIKEMANRMFIAKLRSRSEDGLDDYESLVEVAIKHKEEIKKLFSNL